MPMAAASWTYTTVTATMTAETGRTSLTAVSALASGKERRRGSPPADRAQVPAGAGPEGSSISGEELECWGGAWETGLSALP